MALRKKRSAAAGGDITLTTQTEQHDEQRNHTGTKKGLASSTEDSISQTLAVGSMLSAGSMDISGKNIAVIGNNVVADNDISLRAQENIIVVQGSQLKAGGDTTLDAARDILLLGAANTQKTDGSNSSSGGSVGVSLGFGSSGGGLSIFANANKGHTGPGRWRYGESAGGGFSPVSGRSD